MKLYCCGCKADVVPRLTNGREIYPHRRDLASLPFWRCDACGNYVGCHHKTQQRTKPLGNIPTTEIRMLRRRIHLVIDPLWKSGHVRRGWIYAKLSAAMGYTCHVSEIKSIEEAHRVLEVALELEKECVL